MTAAAGHRPDEAVTRDRLRVGVIGAGFFAALQHIPALQRSGEAEVVAVCRRDERALATVADHFGIAGRYTDYRRLLDEAALDAVVVSSPHALHYEHTRAALERGLPVLTDKPLAVASRDAEDLRACAAARRLPVVVAFGPPYQPLWRYIRTGIGAGAIGAVQLVEHTMASNVDSLGFFGNGTLPETPPPGVVVPPTAFRASAALGGGGYLQDVGSHALGGILVATGLQPVEVTATMDSPDVDLRASIAVRCASGALITVTALANTFPEERAHRSMGRTLVVGTRGGYERSAYGASATLQRWGEPAQPITPEQLPPPSSPVDNFLGVLRGREAPLVPLDAAVRVVRVIEAAYRSARAGVPVHVGDEQVAGLAARRRVARPSR